MYHSFHFFAINFVIYCNVNEFNLKQFAWTWAHLFTIQMSKCRLKFEIKGKILYRVRCKTPSWQGSHRHYGKCYVLRHVSFLNLVSPFTHLSRLCFALLNQPDRGLQYLWKICFSAPINYICTAKLTCLINPFCIPRNLSFALNIFYSLSF